MSSKFSRAYSSTLAQILLVSFSAYCRTHMRENALAAVNRIYIMCICLYEYVYKTFHTHRTFTWSDYL